MPAEREQEDGDHHRHGQGQNDLDEGTEGTRPVNVGGFFQLIGDTLEELEHHKDVQTVLEATADRGQDHQRPIGIGQLEGGACEKGDGTRIIPRHNGCDIKRREVLEQRQAQGVGRDDHDEDHEEHNDLLALEFELGEAVTDHTANEGLQLTVDEMPDEILTHLMIVSKKIVSALKKVYTPNGYSIMQNGGEFNDVGHYHLHIFPRYAGDGFGWTYGEEPKNVNEEIAKRIGEQL